MKDDRLYLIHILECIEHIEDYTSDGESEFLSSTLIQDAVMRNLQIMTESTQGLSPELKAQYPQVEWRELSGFRNVLTHSYLGISINQINEIKTILETISTK